MFKKFWGNLQNPPRVVPYDLNCFLRVTYSLILCWSDFSHLLFPFQWIYWNLYLQSSSVFRVPSYVSWYEINYSTKGVSMSIVKIFVVNTYDLKLSIYLFTFYQSRSKESQSHPPMFIQFPLSTLLGTSLPNRYLYRYTWVKIKVCLCLPMYICLNTYIHIHTKSYMYL